MTPVAAELVLLAKRGDPRACDAVIRSVLPFVGAVARHYSRRTRCADKDDLRAAGSLGAVDALRRFDPQRGVTFLTFARHYIRAAVLAELSQSRSTLSACTRVKSRVAPCVSLDAVAEDGSTLHDVLGGLTDPGEQIDEGAAVRHARRVLADVRLDPLEEATLLERILPHREDASTLEAIALRFGMSRERVRQVECEVREKLRARMAAAPKVRVRARRRDEASGYLPGMEAR